MVPLVSIIIVNYNGQHLMGECLDSVLGQVFRDFEVILVDNASTDSSVAFVKEHYPLVKIIQHHRNLGYGGGNNAGIAASRGRYIALLNNDTKVDSHWLQRLVEVAERDGRVGMYASKILSYSHPEIIDNTGLVMYGDGIARGRGRLERDSGQFVSEEEVFFPSGCAGFYRREMLSAIGPFDEDLFLYLDDVDIGLRGRMNGWKCIYVPDAVVYHKYSASTEPYSPLKAYLVERNRIWIVMKYFPMRMLIMSLFYTLLRYLLQGYGVITGKGASSKFMKSASAWSGAVIICKAYLSAFRGFGTILRKRKQMLQLKAVSNRDMTEWLRRFGIPAREVALKD